MGTGRAPEQMAPEMARAGFFTGKSNLSFSLILTTGQGLGAENLEVWLGVRGGDPVLYLCCRPKIIIANNDVKTDLSAWRSGAHC